MTKITSCNQNNQPSIVEGGYIYQNNTIDTIVDNLISNDTYRRIEYFNHKCQTSNGLSTQEFRTYNSQEVTKSLLINLGFNVNDNSKFIFNNSTNSVGSISLYNTITEIGGDSFQGDIISFIQYMFNVDFIQAWGYIRKCFGASIQLPTQMEDSILLPDPSLYMKQLSLKEFKTI